MLQMDEKLQDVPPGVSFSEQKRARRAWFCGFITVAVFLIFVLIYTFYIRDLTLYQLSILLISLYTMGTMSISLVFREKNKPALNDSFLPFVSIIVPAKNEEKVIEETVRSLFKINYEKGGSVNYEVIIVDDNSSDSTYAILEKLKEEFPSLVPLKRVGGTKGKSAVLNYAVPFSKGEIIAIFDADSRVEPDFLSKSVPYFHNDSIVGVQGRVRILNANDNLLTKFQDDEFSVFAHMLQLSKSMYGGVMQLAGNGQLTRKAALIAVGGWNEKSATDDQDLTMQFLLKGQFIQYAPNSIVWQEAIVSSIPFLRQRIRWAEGMLRCIFDYFYCVVFSRTLSFIQKIDGLAGLMRIVATLVVWIGYIQILTVYFLKLSYVCFVPLAVFSNIMLVPVFAFAMGGGLLKFSDKPSIKDIFRVPLYWVYNVFWLFAAPVGFVNCIKNRDTIEWDKTEHTGTN